MVNDLSNHIADLREMCIKTIELLDDLKEKGKISEEEYQKHVSLKKKFLKDTSLR
jgi:hypothetical protein